MRKFPAVLRIRTDTRDAIKALGSKGQTYDDILRNIPEIWEQVKRLKQEKPKPKR